jgi:viologen exporter family transport system permease protein
MRPDPTTPGRPGRLGVLLFTMRTAVIEAWTNRRSFWFQVTVMIVNDMAWVIFWVLFFRKVGSVRGWHTEQVLLLFAILATVTGVSMGLLANARRVGLLVAEGQLDAVLTLPVDPLGYLLVRQVDTALLGDLAFGPGLFVLAAHPTLERTALYLIGSIVGSVVFVSFVVGLGSMTLLVGGRGEQADLGFQAILILSSYPLDVFGGVTKLVMFTVIPAAFITGLPVHLVDRFTWGTFAALVAAAAVSVVMARAAFRLGLKHYRSGALWTRA